MRKFSFDKEKAAKFAKEVNVNENQQVADANNLLRLANGSDTYFDKQEFLASLSKQLAINISNKNKSISGIINISNGKEPTLKVEPLTECLHGDQCPQLDAPGGRRPVCKKADKPIFDMRQCPLKRWVRTVNLDNKG